jgi:hypothetical protein
MGEFFVDIIGPCDECSEYGDEFASDCESCGGTGEVKYQLAIPWTTIKDIYAKIVCHFGECKKMKIVEPSAKHYKPLRVQLNEVCGIQWAMKAMRLPKRTEGDTRYDSVGVLDAKLASALVRAGSDQAKAIRGIVAYFTLEMQVGFMIEFETYRHGVECLSTSSAMHGELKELTGEELAEQKQTDLPNKYYTRAVMISYQALRAMYKARKNHRHPDWRIFCKFIETLPYFNVLIFPGAK